MMGYWTYFEGNLQIQLKEPHLSNLQIIISQKLNNKDSLIVNENYLKVDDEWKDVSGFMEEVVLFIHKYGVLISGDISCKGEDPKDIWEIFISHKKPFIREIGKMVTLDRSSRKEEYGFSQNSITEIK
jgi:hypothetical protein